MKSQLFVIEYGDGLVAVIGREDFGVIEREKLERHFELVVIL